MAKETDKVSIAVEFKKIGASLEEVKREIGALSNQVKTEGAKVQAETARMSAGFKGISTAISSVKSMLMGFGALAVLRGITRLITSVADAGDQFAKMSQRLGLSVKTLSTFDHVAKLSGLTLEGVAIGLRRFAQNALDMSRGIGEAKREFETLGIPVTDSTGRIRAMEDMLLDVADRFSKMEDGTTKTAMAMRLFGRSGTEMIPMLNKGSAGLREMMEEADRLGLVFTEEAAKAAEDFNDNLTRLKGSFRGISQEIGNEVIPGLTDFTDKLTRLTQYLKEHRTEVGLAWTAWQLMLNPGKAAVSLYEQLGKGATKVRGNIEELIRATQKEKGSLSESNEELAKRKVAMEKLTEATKSLIESNKRLGDQISEQLKTEQALRDLEREDKEKRIKTIDEEFNKRRQAWQEQQDWLKQYTLGMMELDNVTEETTDNMGKKFKDFQGTLKWSLEAGLVDVFKKGFKNIGEAGRQFCDMLEESFARTVAKMITEWLVFKGVTGAVEGISGWFGGGSPKIELVEAQRGGIFTRPTRALIGEAGPEAVVPLAGGRIPVEMRSGKSQDLHIYLVDERINNKGLGPNEVVLVINDDIAKDGVTRKTIKRFL